MSNTCIDCRYWSDMLARSIGGGPVEAMCLEAGSPHSRRYTSATQGCDRWKHNRPGSPYDRGFREGIEAIEQRNIARAEKTETRFTAREYVDALNYGAVLREMRAFERALTEASGGSHEEYVSKWRVSNDA